MSKKNKLILVHVLIGASIFYFLIHPISVVLYWFEYSNTDYSFLKFMEVIRERLSESFSFKMQRMSISFTVLGSFLGLISGLLWIKLIEKKTLIKKQEKLIKNDILQLIELGENNWVEFKSSMKYDYFKKIPNKNLEQVIAKTIVSFMNAKGGKLIIGVDDEGKIMGIENDFKTLKHQNKDGFEQNIFRIISTYIGQEFCYKVQVLFYQINEKEVCLVIVEPSKKPTYVADGKNTTFYVRTGNATYPLTVKETVKYLENRKT